MGSKYSEMGSKGMPVVDTDSKLKETKKTEYDFLWFAFTLDM
jgi:hypothetical protein